MSWRAIWTSALDLFSSLKKICRNLARESLSQSERRTTGYWFLVYTVDDGTVPPQLSQKSPECLALPVVNSVETRVPRLAGVVGPEGQFILFMCSVIGTVSIILTRICDADLGLTVFTSTHLLVIRTRFKVHCFETILQIIYLNLNFFSQKKRSFKITPVEHGSVEHGPQTRRKLRVCGKKIKNLSLRLTYLRKPWYLFIVFIYCITYSLLSTSARSSREHRGRLHGQLTRSGFPGRLAVFGTARLVEQNISFY
jgi:hypothetical protein